MEEAVEEEEESTKARMRRKVARGSASCQKIRHHKFAVDVMKTNDMFENQISKELKGAKDDYLVFLKAIESYDMLTADCESEKSEEGPRR